VGATGLECLNMSAAKRLRHPTSGNFHVLRQPTSVRHGGSVSRGGQSQAHLLSPAAVLHARVGWLKWAEVQWISFIDHSEAPKPVCIDNAL
jgi:hypothetical protein